MTPFRGEGKPVLDSTPRRSAQAARNPQHRVAQAAATARTPDELGSELTAALRDAFGVDQVHLFEVAQDQTGGEAVVRGPGLDYQMALADGPSGVARVLASRAPLHVPDARSGLIRPDLVERFRVASALFVPVAHDDEIRRVAIAISETPRTFTLEDVTFPPVEQGGERE